eukprot:scaffold1584_cov363-Prasinococcus_capsulatus_cf.AAC.4
MLSSTALGLGVGVELLLLTLPFVALCAGRTSSGPQPCVRELSTTRRTCSVSTSCSTICRTVGGSAGTPRPIGKVHTCAKGGSSCSVL